METVTTNTTETVATPTETTAPAVTPQPPVVPSDPKRAAHFAANEAAKRWSQPQTPAPAETTEVTGAVAPVVDGLGREHHPANGQYLPGQTGEAVETQPATTPVATVAETPVAPEAPQTVRIQLPEEVRRMFGGASEIDVPRHLEQGIRWSINNEFRRRTVEEVRTENRQLREQLARSEVLDNATREWRASPEYAAYYQQHTALAEQEEAGEVPKGTADNFAQLVDLKFKEFKTQREDAKLQELRAKDAEADQQEAVAAWVNEAWSRTSQIPVAVRNLPEFSQLFDGACKSFNALIEAGRYDRQLATVESDEERTELGHHLFARYFRKLLEDEPAVLNAYRTNTAAQQEMVRQEAERKVAEERRIAEIKEQARREAAEEFKRQAASVRGAVPPNPLAGLPSTPRAATQDQEPEQKIDRNASAYSVMQQAREQANRIAAQRAAGAPRR